MTVLFASAPKSARRFYALLVRRALTLAAAPVTLAVALGAQTTWYVDAAATPPGTGTQSNPYASIKDAIAQPTTLAGDTVLVLPGTYSERLDFLGKDLVVRGAAGSASTIVDAGATGSVVTFVNGESPAAVLEGLTLRNGFGTGSGSSARGGGILCIGASPTLRDLHVRQNRAYDGSGIYLQNSAARVEHCVIEQNHGPPTFGSSGRGLGVHAVCGSTPYFEHCTIRNNISECMAGGGVYGAGTYVDCVIQNNGALEGAGAHGGNCNPQFLRCTIRGNKTFTTTADPRWGGGVFGPATLTECTITDNVGRFLGGGAIYATLIRCEIARNTVDFQPATSSQPAGGGAVDSTLVDCDVHHNLAIGAGPQILGGHGGGIYRGTAVGTRIWANKAEYGGGVSQANLDRCTVYENAAIVSGGGLSDGGTVRNTIVHGNSTPQVGPTSGWSITYSDVEGGWPGIGNFDLDPAFWMPLAPDLHLKPGSPCIDAGDPASPLDPDGTRADAGAFAFDIGYCAAPDRFCVGKVNSQGCTPSISFEGLPSLGGPDTFAITARDMVNQKPGLLFWGLAPRSAPFAAGSSCVAGPLVRTPAQGSGGSALPAQDCTGTYSFAWTQAYMAAHGVGIATTVYAQWYARDPAHQDGSARSLSDALEFTVCP